MSTVARRLAVVGLDAADLSLVENWSDKGLLPAFARLRKEGAWIKLENRGEFPSTTVWPSIYTGTHPGKNGIYYIVRIAQAKPKLERVFPEQCRQPPFWVQLQTNGIRSIVLDVPFTYPITGLPGLQVSDWGSYDRYASARSEPTRGVRELERRFGRFPFRDELSRNAPITHRDFRRIRHKLLSGIGIKGEAIRFLMRDRPWDFFMSVFAETHPAGHYFWEFHSEPGKSKTHSELSSTLLDVYKGIDQEISKIAALLDGNTSLLIISGHGIGPNHVGWHLLPDILKKIGLSSSEGDIAKDEKRSWLLDLRQSVPRQWRDSVSRFLPNKLRDYLWTHWATSTIDWGKARAISLPTDAHGFVRVSLKGRDSGGQVNPGPEYERICRDLSRTLKDLLDPQTGEPIVDEIFLTDEIFSGPARDSLPDMIVNWRNTRKIEEARSKEIGAITGTLPDRRSGNHRAEGFALFYGPDGHKGRVAKGHLLDIAPTILNFYGLEAPDSFDGRPWTEIVL